MVFIIEGVVTQPVIEEWPSSDHAAILTTIKTFLILLGRQEEKKVVEKLRLEELFK